MAHYRPTLQMSAIYTHLEDFCYTLGNHSKVICSTLLQSEDKREKLVRGKILSSENQVDPSLAADPMRWGGGRSLRGLCPTTLDPTTRAGAGKRGFSHNWKQTCQGKPPKLQPNWAHRSRPRPWNVSWRRRRNDGAQMWKGESQRDPFGFS